MGDGQLIPIKSLLYFFCFLMILPIYRHVYSIHTLIDGAMEKGIWCELPPILPLAKDVYKDIQNHAEKLHITVQIKDNVICFQAKQTVNFYQFLHLINCMPTVVVTSFDMKEGKGKIHIHIHEPDHQKSSGQKCRPLQKLGVFYKPRYCYVNARTVIGHAQQFWVNESLSDTVPCPIYHTIDEKTGKVTKGDTRPKLQLISN